MNVRHLLRPLAMRLGRTIESQQFNPRWWGVLVNPFFITRRGLSKEIARCARVMRGGQLLDIGCGTMPYRSLFAVDHYWGVEIWKRGLPLPRHSDVIYDGSRLPFKSSSLDHVLLSEVLEHVFEPRLLLAELRRVLRPGGFVLLTVPFLWDEHEQPYDYGRYSSFGLRYLLEQHGFEICYLGKNGTYLTALAQMLSSYIYTISRAWPWPLRFATYGSFCATVQFGGQVLGALAPKNPDLYLDNIVLARKSTNAVVAERNREQG